MSETPSLKSEKKVSNMGLLVRAGLAIILFDRWVMGLIKAVSVHKGPWLTIRPQRRMSRRAKLKEKDAMKKKIFGYSVAGALGVMVLAVVGIKAWGYISAKIDAARNPPVA